MHNGWICLHRSMLDWEWYGDINVCRLFTHCLLRANHSPKKWRGMDINRGQFWTSLDTLSRETGLSVKQIRTCFTKLERTGEVTSKGQAKGRMVTISNYDSYQDKGKLEGSEKTSKGQSEGKQGATNNNDNNDNKLKEGAEAPAPVKTARFGKPTLSEAEQYRSSKQLNMKCSDFIDHFDSNGWKVGGKAPMKDWRAAMRQWAKRDFGGNNKKSQGGINW